MPKRNLDVLQGSKRPSYCLLGKKTVRDGFEIYRPYTFMRDISVDPIVTTIKITV
jgi:hypothetical protein